MTDGDREEVDAKLALMRALSWTPAELNAVLKAWHADARTLLILLDPS